MYQKYLKRVLDFIAALLGLILLSPLFLVIAVLVCILLGRPIIFRQKRPGKDGEVFTLYKFRTMRDAVDAEGKKLTDTERQERLSEDEGVRAVIGDEQRLTRFGSILRALSLDELPELVNILRGEMSFIGPRPLATIYLPYYNEEEKRRHDVRPGLTGLAQVNGRNALSWEERFKYDLDYVGNISFTLDVYILWRTFVVVFKRENIGQGAEKPMAFHLMRQRRLREPRER